MAKIHLIGNAHLDPVWLWQWQEGFAEIKATFRSALDRMRDFPEFVFTCACAAYYKWVEENEPAMFAEIQARVAEGRWVIVGGWWIQPDCNLPSGESFARHSLYGQRYFVAKFGRIAKVGYNVDSFGHHGMMPQLLKKSGMDYYVFMRPQEHEKQLPANLFWWESADGSRVMTFRIPDAYTVRDTEQLTHHIQKHGEMAEAEGAPYMSFYGVGNHGGGPTVANLLAIRELTEKGCGDIALSSPDAYFAEVAALDPPLPVLRDELQMHAIGCYSTHSESKKYNRKAEHRLLSAEKWSSLAHLLLNLPYPKQQLLAAWENVMFNQFHDIMGGCSIKEAFEDARESYGEALHLGAKALNAAMQKISWNIGTMKPQVAALSKEKDSKLWEQDDLGVPFVVFNPLSWEVEALVQANKMLAGAEDDTGAPLPVQKVRASRIDYDDKWDTLFPARVPAFGYRVFWMYRDKAAAAKPSTGMLRAEPYALENTYIRLEFDESRGSLTRLYDKRPKKEMIAAEAAVPIVIDETDSDTWGHGLVRYRNEIGRFADASIQVIEEGPLRATLRITSRYGASVLRQDFSLRHDSPDIQVKATLDWRERHRMLKLSFPVQASEPQAVWEIPYGYIERKTDGQEVPGQQWVSVSDRLAEGGGIGIVNDAKYGYDVLDNDIRLTIVRSPIYADHYGERDDLVEYMDQGIQEFSYGIIPYAGDWRDSGIPRKANEWNVPPLALWETYHEGPLPQSAEGIRVSANNVIADVLKQAEDGNGWIVRCHEAAGRATKATIGLPLHDREWNADFGICEVKSFFIPEDRSVPVSEVDLLEYGAR
ncbi:alpha-mannosidase [Cohnella fermenti]|uniref:alpha-mannosidase n=1 Tax=Cohnella fermenti TaxID=2565925 RepID=UPI001454BCD7|nr:alpha-mannosidase [Cohnella fermenti]